MCIYSKVYLRKHGRFVSRYTMYPPPGGMTSGCISAKNQRKTNVLSKKGSWRQRMFVWIQHFYCTISNCFHPQTADPFTLFVFIKNSTVIFLVVVWLRSSTQLYRSHLEVLCKMLYNVETIWSRLLLSWRLKCSENGKDAVAKKNITMSFGRLPKSEARDHPHHINTWHIDVLLRSLSEVITPISSGPKTGPNSETCKGLEVLPPWPWRALRSAYCDRVHWG